MEPGALGKIVLIPYEPAIAQQELRTSRPSGRATVVALFAVGRSSRRAVALRRAPRGTPDARRTAKPSTTRTASSATAPAGKGDGPRLAVPDAAAARLHHGQVQDPLDRNRHVPTDDDLIRSVRQGLYGRRCRAGQRILSDADIRDVVSYIKTLSPRFATSRRQPIAIGAADAELARERRPRRGRSTRSCSAASATAPTAAAPARSRPTFEDDWKQPLRAADLTEPWTFHGGADVARHLHAVPHRHVRHADAVVCRTRPPTPRCGTSPTTSCRSRASRCGR